MNILRFTAVFALLVSVLSLFSCSDSKNSSTNPVNQPESKYGTLDITINGLAVNQVIHLTITGPESLNINSSGHTVLDSLLVGLYTITPLYIIDPPSDTIPVTIPAQSVLVEDNKTTPMDIIYQSQQFGSLGVSFSGLPDGVNGFVRLERADNTFIQNITDSIQIDSLFVGSYRLISSQVLAANDREFFPIVDTSYASVTDGTLTNVTVVYQSGFYYEVFGRYNLNSTYASVSASVDGTAHNDTDSNNGSGSGVEYTTDGCRLTDYNYEDGYIKSASAATAGGSASINQTLVNSRASQTVTFSSSAEINSSVPSASSFGIMSVNAQNNPYPFVIQFDNPFRDSVVVTVSWSTGGSASAGATDISRAGSQVQAVMYIHQSGCFSSLFTTSVPFSFSAYESSSSGNFATSGQTTIVFKSQFYLVGFDLYTRAFGNSYFEATGGSNDGSGSSTANMTVNIEVQIQNY